jgi:hypothetical protein
MLHARENREVFVAKPEEKGQLGRLGHRRSVI